MITNKFKTFCIRIGTPFGISFILNIFLILFNCIFMNPHFETNDDSGMSYIVEGIYGEKTAYMVFINVVIGKILKILYTISPLIKWYSIFQYIVLFIAFTLLGDIILKQGKKKYSILLVLSVLIPFTFECYTSLQFTKTAGISVAVGLLTLFYVLRCGGSKFYIVLGIMLSLIGSMIRFQSLLMVSLVMAILGVDGIWKIYVSTKKNIKQTLVGIRGYLICFGITFFLCFMAEGIDRKAYQSDEGWNYFLSYNEARYKLTDYGFPNWDDYSEEYKKMGFDKADIEMYKSWTFADFDKLTIEKMNQIEEMKSRRHITTNTVVSFLKDIPRRFISMHYSIIFCIILIIYLIYCREKRWNVLVYLLMTFVGSYFYFFFKQRYTHINRIDMIYIFSMICLLIELLGQGQLMKKRHISYVFSFILLLSCINVAILAHKDSIGYEEKEMALIKKASYQEFYKLTTEDEHKLYLQSTSSTFNHYAYDIWEVAPVGMSKNRFSLGNWSTGSPLSMAILDNYNIQNPFKDLVDNPDVYLIDNNGIETELSYIQRNYNKDAKSALVKNIKGFNVFKIYTDIDEFYVDNLIKDSPNIKNEANIEYSEEDSYIYINGSVYKNNVNSFENEYYIDLYNLEEKSHDIRYLTQLESDKEDQYNGKYSGFDQSIDTSNLKTGKYILKLILRVDSENYLAVEKEIDIKQKQ